MAHNAADGSAAAPPLTVDDVLGVSSLLNNLSFFLNLKMMVDVLGVRDVEIPPEVSQILELAKKLPDATQEQWLRLMAGKVHTAAEEEAKAKAAAKASKTPAKATAGEGEGEGTAKRKRQAWTEENKNELVRLGDDKEYRKQVTGMDELNWTHLAKHLGFSTGQVVHRKYCALKGIALPPSAKKAKAEAAAEGLGTEVKIVEEDVEVLPQVPAGSGGGWSKEQEAELLQLVKDETYRKQVLGKPKLKWARLAEHLERSKKDVKAKYSAMTGEDVE